MFTYDFMQNAFAAAGIVAALCGLVGFFLVLRSQAFAGRQIASALRAVRGVVQVELI